MKLLINKISSDNFPEFIILDNDFLGEIFSSDEIFIQFINEINKNSSEIFIDEFIRLEFLRDIYYVEGRLLREEFMKSFGRLPLQNDILNKLFVNALLLSKIYRKNSNQKGKETTPSTTDLMLAARLMLNAGNLCIITGNKKHFPDCIFDTQYIFSILDKEFFIKNSFYMLKFNTEKFKKNYEDLEKYEASAVKDLNKKHEEAI